MNNLTKSNGWLGTGGVILMPAGGTCVVPARPRPAHPAVWGDGIFATRSGVQQQA